MGRPFAAGVVAGEFPDGVECHFMTSAIANVVRTIRLDEAELAALFDRLDAKTEGAEAREHERFLYRHKIILVRIEQPGDGEPTNFVCPTRNVSRGGLACLHGGYIHVGSAVVAHLRTTRGGFDAVPGCVVRCEHVRGAIHDVGIRFDYWIDPARYCHEAVRYQALMLEPDKSAADTMRDTLGRLSCNIAFAENAGQLRSLAAAGLYDVVLVDAPAVDSDAASAVRALREQGVTDTFIAITATLADDAKQTLLAGGFDHALPGPVDPAALIALVRPLLATPIHSTLKTDRRTEAVLSTFLKSLPGRVRALERAIVTGDGEPAELLHALRRSTAALGYEPVASAAEALERLAREAPEKSVLRPPLIELTGLCRRMRP